MLLYEGISTNHFCGGNPSEQIILKVPWRVAKWEVALWGPLHGWVQGIKEAWSCKSLKQLHCQMSYYQ